MTAMYAFRSSITKIEEHKRIVRGYKDEHGQAQFEEKSLGWFIHLDGSWESLGVGAEKPDLNVGQQMKVLLIPV